MRISKLQYGNPLLQAVHRQKGKIQAWSNQGIQQVGMQARQAEEQYTQYRKADARANKKTRAPMQSNNLAKLQDQLWRIGAFKGVKDRKGNESTYQTAVDGIKGNMTNTAIANAQKMGYTINNDGSISKVSSKVTSAAKKKEATRTRFMTSSGSMMPAQVMAQASEAIANNRTLQNTADFLGHNPAIIALEDLDRANSNRLTGALFGIRPFKGRTITRLPNLQTEELKKQVLFARSKGQNNFNSDMYRAMYGYNYASRNGKDGQDRSGFWSRMSTPTGRLEHTLGAYGFYVDKNGDTIVEDTYDFNVGQKQGGDGRYAVTRNFLGEFGSKSTDPNEGKIKYRINLGKL